MVFSISNIAREIHKDSQDAHQGGQLSFECRSVILGFRKSRLCVKLFGNN